MAVSSDATSDAEATAYEGRADSRSSESARSGDAGLLIVADTEETRRAIAAWVGRR